MGISRIIVQIIAADLSLIRQEAKTRRFLSVLPMCNRMSHDFLACAA